jgi:hypothetical protein
MNFPSSDVRQTFTAPLSFPLISYANAPQVQTIINAGTFINKKKPLEYPKAFCGIISFDTLRNKEDELWLLIIYDEAAWHSSQIP